MAKAARIEEDLPGKLSGAAEACRSIHTEKAFLERRPGKVLVNKALSLQGLTAPGYRKDGTDTQS